MFWAKVSSNTPCATSGSVAAVALLLVVVPRSDSVVLVMFIRRCRGGGVRGGNRSRRRRGRRGREGRCSSRHGSYTHTCNSAFFLVVVPAAVAVAVAATVAAAVAVAVAAPDAVAAAAVVVGSCCVCRCGGCLVFRAARCFKLEFRHMAVQKTVWTNHLYFACRIDFCVIFLAKHVRFHGCTVPKLEISHMAAWTSMRIYSHPLLLRSRFVPVSRLPSSLDLLPWKDREGAGGLHLVCRSFALCRSGFAEAS